MVVVLDRAVTGVRQEGTQGTGIRRKEVPTLYLLDLENEYLLKPSALGASLSPGLQFSAIRFGWFLPSTRELKHCGTWHRVGAQGRTVMESSKVKITTSK